MIAAAEAGWEQVLRRAHASLKDPHDGVKIVERMAATVSRILRRHDRPPIKDIEAYFTWACIRCIYKTAARESREESGHALAELECLGARSARNPEDRLLEELQIGEVISYMGDRTRTMIAMRSEGYSWDEIAAALGYANGHSAEVQYGKLISAIRRRLFGRPHGGRRPSGVDE